MENRSHQGIDINRLINKESYKNFDQLIKCRICFNILLNPQDCEQCGNTFCKECISQVIVNKKPCPFNCENFTIKPSSLSITSFLSSMKFNCLNKELGCSNTLTFLQVPAHDRECNLALASCPNVKCKKQVRRQTLEFHIRKECEFSLFKCLNCDQDLQRQDYLEHVENCKIVSDIFNHVEPILNLDEASQYEQINLKELSIGNFMKMILLNIAKISNDSDKKLDFITKEIKSIKEDLNKQTSGANLILEGINSELEVLNERISHIEAGLSTNENVKKMLEDNIKETLVIKDSLIEKTLHSKEGSVSSTSNNSKNNSAVLNVVKIAAEQNSVNNTGVKKINIKTLPKTQNRSPHKSPVNTQTRSSNQKTYNIETESYQIKTSSLTLIKSTIRNQEIILEHFHKMLNRLDLHEASFSSEICKIQENIKSFVLNELVEEIKCINLETSLDNSNRIVKKIEDLWTKS